jgi:hypothetical protein
LTQRETVRWAHQLRPLALQLRTATAVVWSTSCPINLVQVVRDPLRPVPSLKWRDSGIVRPVPGPGSGSMVTSHANRELREQKTGPETIEKKQASGRTQSNGHHRKQGSVLRPATNTPCPESGCEGQTGGAPNGVFYGTKP